MSRFIDHMVRLVDTNQAMWLDVRDDMLRESDQWRLEQGKLPDWTGRTKGDGIWDPRRPRYLELREVTVAGLRRAADEFGIPCHNQRSNGAVVAAVLEVVGLGSLKLQTRHTGWAAGEYKLDTPRTY